MEVAHARGLSLPQAYHFATSVSEVTSLVANGHLTAHNGLRMVIALCRGAIVRADEERGPEEDDRQDQERHGRR